MVDNARARAASNELRPFNRGLGQVCEWSVRLGTGLDCGRSGRRRRQLKCLLASGRLLARRLLARGLGGAQRIEATNSQGGDNNESGDGHHKAVQTRRRPRRSDQGRRCRSDGHGSEGLRAAEGPYRNLSRRRICREAPCPRSKSRSLARPARSTKSSTRSRRRPKPDRSATARFSCSVSTTRCASVPAKPTPPRCSAYPAKSLPSDLIRGWKPVLR